MHLVKDNLQLFSELTNLLLDLSDEQYTVARPTLSGKSIADLVQKIINEYTAFLKGSEGKCIFYENDKDPVDAKNIHSAVEVIDLIKTKLLKVNLKKPTLILGTLRTPAFMPADLVSSSVEREMIYLFEKTANTLELIRLIQQISKASILKPEETKRKEFS